MDMKELVKTVMRIVLFPMVRMSQVWAAVEVSYTMTKWQMMRNKAIRALPIQL
jgi:hypothetical protein